MADEKGQSDAPSVRFQVTKAGNAEESNALGEAAGKSYGTTGAGRLPDQAGNFVIYGEDGRVLENQKLTEEDEDDRGEMALYSEDFKSRPRVPAFLEKIGSYRGGMAPTSAETKEASKAPKQVKLGVMLGVFLPCIQNIFGVLLFIRMAWIIGTAGILESFILVFISCLTTFLTTISLSAIATNGIVPAGGSYFMISRALGPEFGGAVGILFYLGTTFAGAMYIMGAVEILLVYIAPMLVFSGDWTDITVRGNNVRAYGTCLLLLLAGCVFIGVRFVSKVATVSLACVILSILAMYIGFFAAKEDSSVMICALGDRLLARDAWTDEGADYCNKNRWLNMSDNSSTELPLYQRYCEKDVNGTFKCDPYFTENEVRYFDGIPGLASGIFYDNIKSFYTDKGYIYGSKEEGDSKRGEIFADISSSFMVLLAIYFPSCTGIMAGSNRSGDLNDAQGSIPKGTIAATLTTSFVYISVIMLFGGTVDGMLLRDKFGDSLGTGGLVAASMAWPHRWVLMIGAFLSTIGAGLQSLTGAPRLLQAIAKDEVIPIIRKLSFMTKRGEPVLAILVTVGLCECGILSGNLDILNPIITMFFLMCYAFVNFAVVLQSLMQAPGWRPRFRFFHWFLSLIGMLLCVALMFISSWWAALVAIALAGGIYKYIEYKGAEQEWGDGFRGLAMSAARYALLKLQQGPPHTKNWRPQLLALCKLDAQLQPKHPKLLAFCSQLKAGKGLTLVASILEGDFTEDMQAKCAAGKQTMVKVLEENKLKGFTDVMCASSTRDGICSYLQVGGLGGLRHNTVLLGWPYDWQKDRDTDKARCFIDTIRNVQASQACLLVARNINQFPDSSERLEGHIDIWWIVHDGGLLMLLPYLLTKHKTWTKCKLRIFAIAQMEDNSIQMKDSLIRWLYNLRIPAHVEVVEMADKDITAYVYERTAVMEERVKYLREMKMDRRDLDKEPQQIVDEIHRRSSTVGSPLPGGASSLAGIPEEQPDEGTKLMEPPTVVISAEGEDAVEFEKKPNGNPVVEPSTSAGGGASPPRQGVPNEELNQYTFSPGALLTPRKPLDSSKLDQKNVRRMHTAVRLNEIIYDRSHGSQLVILNLPPCPRKREGDLNYLEYLEVLSEGLDRVIMVRGSGREVVTEYS